MSYSSLWLQQKPSRRAKRVCRCLQAAIFTCRKTVIDWAKNELFHRDHSYTNIPIQS